MSYKWWLCIAVVLFGIGIALGLATPASMLGLLSEDVAALEEMAGLLESIPLPYVFIIILVKNASALLISLALSPIFCLVPVLALVVNGWIIGLVSVAVVQEESLGYLLAGLLPHGVFEIPALIMGEAAALSLGTAVILSIFKKSGGDLLRSEVKRTLRYLLIALALLLPAAIIETFVTPLFLGG